MNTAVERLVFGRRSSVPETRDLPRARTILAGRTLLALIFILSGIGKFMDWSSNVAYMETQGLVWIPLFLAAAAIVEIAGGLSVLTGTFARVGALLLFLYLIPVTLLFHDFWTLEGAARQTQMINFLKNLSVMGGLLLVVGYGAGRMSVDDRLKSRL